MYRTTPYGLDYDDDDAPPPGFGPVRPQQYDTRSTTAAPHASRQPPTEGYGTRVCYPVQQPTDIYNHSTPVQGSVPAAAGAARQFQRAISSSIATARAPPTSSKPDYAASRSAQPSPEPDYGAYDDDDDDYGSSSRQSSRQLSSSRSTPNRSSRNSFRHGTSDGHLNHVADSANGFPRPGSQQRGSGSSSPAPGRPPSVQQQRHQHARSATPDYGAYDTADDYGSETRNRRSSSRRHSKAAAVVATAEESAAAALQGISKPSRKGPPGQQQRAGPGHTGLSAKRTAELETELAALRTALLEAEAKQVEAQMAVLTLETDKSSLQAQLQGMRQQKQQLEMMLLFGGGDEMGHNSEQHPDDSYLSDYSSEPDDTASQSESAHDKPCHAEAATDSSKQCAGSSDSADEFRKLVDAELIAAGISAPVDQCEGLQDVDTGAVDV